MQLKHTGWDKARDYIKLARRLHVNPNDYVTRVERATLSSKQLGNLMSLREHKDLAQMFKALRKADDIHKGEVQPLPVYTTARQFAEERQRHVMNHHAYWDSVLRSWKKADEKTLSEREAKAKHKKGKKRRSNHHDPRGISLL